MLVCVELLLSDITWRSKLKSASLGVDISSSAETRMRTSLEKLIDMLWPFGSQFVCTSERSISTADNERIDAVLDQVVRSRATALSLPESGATSCANERATQAGEPSNVVPSDLRTRILQTQVSNLQRHRGTDVKCSIYSLE